MIAFVRGPYQYIKITAERHPFQQHANLNEFSLHYLLVMNILQKYFDIVNSGRVGRKARSEF